MTFATVQDGTPFALLPPDPSTLDAKPRVPVTTGDLFSILGERPPRSLPMLRTACGWLGRYLDLPGDQIPIDLIEDKKHGFRPFLESRRLKENSVRSYVYQQRSILKLATRYGWRPEGNAGEAWMPILKLAVGAHLTDIARHFSRSTKSPSEVTVEAVDRWGEARILEGVMFSTVAHKKNCFLRLLQKAGWLTATPKHLLRFEKYGIPLEEMNPGLGNDIRTALKWKQAPVAKNRPKHGKIRAITANNGRLILTQLAGYVINVCGRDPQSLSELLQQDTVEGFIEWVINERGVKGRSIQGRLAGILAIVKYHPMFNGQDFRWLEMLIDGIPCEDMSEVKKRKAAKYVSYEELETIPARIRAFRETYEKKRNSKPARVAHLAMEELMLRWFLVLPWRQRNLRECRVSGRSPNLFKTRIPSITQIDKPAWVIEEETRNPNAEFWMISFNPDETKTHITVDLVLPRTLIEPLERYLSDYRPILVNGRCSEMLFVNMVGKKIRADRVEKIIGHWTTTCTGTRTIPHMIRDSVAFRWLKAHPGDFLTLSKILWHRNVQTTIGTYGSRFNESSGTCAMEAWLEQRGANN